MWHVRDLGRSLLVLGSRDAGRYGREAGGRWTVCWWQKLSWSLCRSATVGNMSLRTRGDLSILNLRYSITTHT